MLIVRIHVEQPPEGFLSRRMAEHVRRFVLCHSHETESSPFTVSRGKERGASVKVSEPLQLRRKHS